MRISQALEIAAEHHRAGRLELAEEIYRRVLAVEPDQPDALHLAGVIAHQQGRHAAALEAIQRAIARDGSRAEFHNNLGIVHRALGRMPEAIACHRRAVALRPDFAEAYYNLGVDLSDGGETLEALDCYEQAIALKPDYAKAHNNLGIARRVLGRPDEAADCFRRAIALDADFAEAHQNLGNALHEQGATAEALSCYRRALALKPDDPKTHSNLLSAGQFLPEANLAGLAEGCAEFQHRHAARLRAEWPVHDNDPDPERTLRLGFVSADFGRHPVGFFLVRAMENLDARAFQSFCYSDRVAGDELTQRFRRAAAGWCDAAALSDQQLAEQVRADRIDVLFDLAGHTAGNRLMCFARKPAPVQLSWIGCEGEVGLEEIDGLVADRFLVAEGEQRCYREAVLRLPDAYVCYDPPGQAPAVAGLPALQAGRVTFGSFNNPSKFNAPLMRAWAEILRRVPDATLILKYSGLDHPRARKRIEGRFREAGGDAARLELRGWSPYAEMLSQYADVDLALDPFPFCGGATTCEALWMGVPVVTCPGQTWPSRRGATLLSAAGARESIAADVGDYVPTAVRLATDLGRLAEIRAALRPRMAQSPLCDGARLAGNLARVLRDAWRQWCQRRR